MIVRAPTVIVCLLFALPSKAGEPVKLDQSFEQEVLGRHIEVLEDASGNLTIDDVTSPAYDTRFIPSESQYPSFGYTDAAYWIRFTTENRTDHPVEWILELDYSLLDDVRFYRLDAAGTYHAVKTGDEVPFERRAIAHRTFAFRTLEPPGRHTHYLRVQTSSPLNLPLTILTPEAFSRKQNRENLFLWLYYGLMLGLFIYNGFLAASLRDRAYLFYILYIGSYVCFQFTHNGLGAQYLWPQATIWNSQALLFFGSLGSLFMCLFTRSFLETARTLPRLDKVLVGLIVANLVGLVLTLVYIPVIYHVGSVAMVLVALVLLTTGVVALKGGFRAARYYVLGWSVLLLGITISLMKALGLLPISFVTTWGFQAASAVEVLLLSIALADRINLMGVDLERLNTNLEDIVEERTERLRDATRQMVERSAELEQSAANLRQEIEERRRSESERTKLEDQLRQAQKMEAIGRLAGGVAHDMNNVLGAIMGCASLMKMSSEPDHPFREDVQDILAATERGKDLTGKLLGFARKGTYLQEIIQPNALIEELHSVLSRTGPKSVAVELQLESDLQAVEGDPNQLVHALMNLSLNGIQAIKGRGTLSISSRNMTVDEVNAGQYHPLAPGRYVEIVVSDTGAGMDAETKARAFEPFFTTKPRGEGSGLGLSMVYGTISNHGGLIMLESEPEQGTRASVLLPAREAQPLEPSPKVIPSPKRGSGTLLLVDDEKMIRHVAKRMLEAAGYDVLLAENGQVAVDLYRQRKDEIQLVILDMLMPVLDGVETFFKLRQIDDGVRILLASGYSNQEKVKELQKLGAQGFIEKPFRMEVLLEAVCRAIEPVRPHSLASH